MALGTVPDVVLETRQGRMAETSAHVYVNALQYTKDKHTMRIDAVGDLNMCALCRCSHLLCENISNLCRA